MSRTSIALTAELYDYLLSVSLREHPLLKRLREETARHPESNMQISPEQGQFMAFLLRLIGARLTLEVGVFTGYSSLSAAMALPADGKVVALDNDPEVVRTAQRYWAEAGVEHRVELRLGPATETLQELLDEGLPGRFDFAFIDADKAGMPVYYEKCLELVRQGGLIVVDNTLWSGRVADPSEDDEDTRTIREFNRSLHHDVRVDLSLLPVGDGLTLARKR
ncbi:MAG: class I SAM-dependent methyltransferase [Gemmatimonadales bacterium]